MARTRRNKASSKASKSHAEKPFPPVVTGAPTILDVLAQDHRALEQQIKALAMTPSTEPEQRTAQFTALQALLQSHARAEEEVVYRRLLQQSPDEFTTLEAFEEHHVVDVLLQELASSCPGGVGWTAKLRVLEELLQHHIKEEELDLFAVVRAQIDEPTQRRMAIEFRVAKHEGLERFLAPIRRVTPAFAGRATIYAQAAAGRMVRRGELYLRRALSRMPEA